MQQEMNSYKSENSCRHIIEHDSGAVGKLLQLAHWRRLHDVEHSEKYKARKKSFPCSGTAIKAISCPATSSITTNWDLSARCSRYARCRRDADQRNRHR
jgi:hypothetical protein